MEIPIRLCCGKRHTTPRCLDGRVMCQLCFERVPTKELNVLEDGNLEDVCKQCAEKEKQAMEEKE